jgi:hypothetical protein
VSLRSRLCRLERTRPKHAAPEARRLDQLTGEGWLDVFEELGRAGYLDQEPDFPIALATYRDALRQEKEQRDPSLGLPAAVAPQSFAAPPGSFGSLLREGHIWLVEMLWRRQNNIPAVTEAEFGDLASWFNSSADRLLALSRPSYLLDIGSGRKESIPNLRCMLEKGSRALHAGEVAEEMRQLRARYGEVAHVCSEAARSALRCYSGPRT